MCTHTYIYKLMCVYVNIYILNVCVMHTKKVSDHRVLKSRCRQKLTSNQRQATPPMHRRNLRDSMEPLKYHWISWRYTWYSWRNLKTIVSMSLISKQSLLEKRVEVNNITPDWKTKLSIINNVAIAFALRSDCIHIPFKSRSHFVLLASMLRCL
jgi:hypothetical protein